MIKSILAALLSLLVLILIVSVIPFPKGVTYDCRLAEISPDFPIEVKNECRKRMIKQ